MVNRHRPFPLRELHFTDNNRSNVERPWGILSLWKTRFWLPVNFRELHSTKDNRSHVCGILLKQLVFLMVNHHGHLPFRELHSTDDNRSSVERPWGILSLFMTWFQLQVKSPFQRLTQTYMYVASLRSRLFFLWWITSPTTTDIVWRDPGGSWACLRPGSDYEWIHLSRGCDTDICMYVASLWSRSFFLQWITVDPSPLGNFTPPTTTDLVWRDPGGSWACLRPAQIMSEFTFPEAVTQTYICMWHLCEAGRFSSGESPWTPPL